MDYPYYDYRIESRERLRPGVVRYHGIRKADKEAFYVDVRSYQLGDEALPTHVAKFSWASGRDDPDYPADEVYDAIVVYYETRGWAVHFMDRLHVEGTWLWDDYEGS